MGCGPCDGLVLRACFWGTNESRSQTSRRLEPAMFVTEEVAHLKPAWLFQGRPTSDARHQALGSVRTGTGAAHRVHTYGRTRHALLQFGLFLRGINMVCPPHDPPCQHWLDCLDWGTKLSHYASLIKLNSSACDTEGFRTDLRWLCGRHPTCHSTKAHMLRLNR